MVRIVNAHHVARFHRVRQIQAARANAVMHAEIQFWHGWRHVPIGQARVQRAASRAYRAERRVPGARHHHWISVARRAYPYRRRYVARVAMIVWHRWQAAAVA